MAAVTKTKVVWNSKAILDLMREITDEQENISAQRIWSTAIHLVPKGKYGSYRYEKSRKPLIRRGKQKGRGVVKKDWQIKRVGTLMRSIKRVSSKFKEGGKLVWVGNERIAYYAHFIEFGTVFMRMRRGYRFLRKAINKERNRFLKELQAKVNG